MCGLSGTVFKAGLATKFIISDIIKLYILWYTIIHMTWLLFKKKKEKLKIYHKIFIIQQVSFFSTSPELSNKARFEYFTRTIPSDLHQVISNIGHLPSPFVFQTCDPLTIYLPKYHRIFGSFNLKNNIKLPIHRHWLFFLITYVNIL